MKRYLVLATLFMLGGCAAMGPKMSGLREGMSRRQVENKLGRPDGFNRMGEYVQLQYGNRLTSNTAHDRADYNVILKNDSVVAYGQGTVRVKESGGASMMFIVPLNSPGN